MERAAWTDERLDDLSRRMDAGFDRVDADIRELRAELRNGLGGVRTELGDGLGGLGAELRGEIGAFRTEIRGEIDALRLTMLRVGGGVIVGLVGVIAAVLASS